MIAATADRLDLVVRRDVSGDVSGSAVGLGLPAGSSLDEVRTRAYEEPKP